ncbi:MAG: right-handed parallel beta-helix repeat-containing protein [Micropruina sp.]
MPRTPQPRIITVLAASTATLASFAIAPAAHAVNLHDATSALAIGGRYQVTRITHTGDITADLTAAAKAPASADQPRVITLPTGTLRLTAQVRVASHVYLVAESGTTVQLAKSADQLLWFNAVTGGVYGGTWDAAGKASSVIGTKASTVRMANLTVRNAKKNGIVGYAKTRLTLSGVTSTGNANDGIYLAEASTLDATKVRAVKNRRNGMQLSSGARGTIDDSTLDGNGVAVTGSTTGKVGHGLGVASARATVTDTSMSSNGVCGASLTGSVNVTLARTTLSGNGRHGVGTTPGVKAAISDSVVSNNGYNGVLASGSGTQLRLDRVTIAGTSRHGLSVPSKGTATLHRSTITTSGASNISVSDKGTLSMDGENRVTGGRAEGITVTRGSKLTVTSTGNVIGTNKASGLMVSGKGTSGRISKSVTFEANGKYGILVKTKAKLATVANSFVKNKSAAIHQQSGGKVTKI